MTVKKDDVTSGRRNVDPHGRLRAVTGGYGRLRAVTAGSGAKWVKLDLVKITLEGKPKMRDHSDK